MLVLPRKDGLTSLFKEARVFNLDGPIRANRLPDSTRLIRANHFTVWFAQIISRFPKWTPFFCESRFRALKIANRRFEANRSKRYENRVPPVNRFLRIDLRESPRSECTKIARFSAVAAAIIFTARGKSTRLFKAPRCAISSAKKISLANRDFFCDANW